MWTGENDLNTVTCGRGTFRNRESIYPVLNLHGYVWTGPILNPLLHLTIYIEATLQRELVTLMTHSALGEPTLLNKIPIYHVYSIYKKTSLA